jgi:site-specific recombinase
VAALAAAPTSDRFELALSAFAAERVGANPTADSIELFIQLFDAIRPRWREGAEAAVARYAAMLARLEADPAVARGARQALQQVMASRRLVGFFADSGILPSTGFFSEFGRIVAQRLLPELPDDSEFSGALHRVFHRRDDWVWMEQVPQELSDRFWTLLAFSKGDSQTDLDKVLGEMMEAALVLAYRIGGIGIEREFGRLGPRFARHAQRFRGLAGATQRFVDGCRLRMMDPQAPYSDEAEVLVLIDQCVEALDEARRACLQKGTSLRLTFLMRRTWQSLKRLDVLARLLGMRHRAAVDADMHSRAQAGWSELARVAVRAENRRNSLRELFSKSVGLLALRVSDNAARTGEHYIAGSSSEYYGMWRAAMGAGLIIAVMALIKIFTSGLDLAPIGYAVFYSLIYGLGFVIIYMLHLTVATKQPAMTAQTLAGFLGESRSGRVADLERLVDLIAAVARTQVAAICGNVLVAMPTAMLIAATWGGRYGEPLISEAKALHLLHDLDPLGWALPHAAIAGVFLFLSGVLSGYFDNQASYGQIGARVARLRWLGAVAGAARAQRVGQYVEDHLGGLMGNFLFGCMLGSAGTIGLILGLPIDIRHIAFAAANYGYALTVLEFGLPWQAMLWALLGVALIGFTNLAVSFALALWMALKARGIVFTQTRELLRRLARRFWRQPSTFLLPRNDLGAQS